jgi:hypothetical protein
VCPADRLEATASLRVSWSLSSEGCSHMSSTIPGMVARDSSLYLVLFLKPSHTSLRRPKTASVTGRGNAGLDQGTSGGQWRLRRY